MLKCKHSNAQSLTHTYRTDWQQGCHRWLANDSKIVCWGNDSQVSKIYVVSTHVLWCIRGMCVCIRGMCVCTKGMCVCVILRSVSPKFMNVQVCGLQSFRGRGGGGLCLRSVAHTYTHTHNTQHTTHIHNTHTYTHNTHTYTTHTYTHAYTHIHTCGEMYLSCTCAHTHTHTQVCWGSEPAHRPPGHQHWTGCAVCLLRPAALWEEHQAWGGRASYHEPFMNIAVCLASLLHCVHFAVKPLIITLSWMQLCAWYCSCGLPPIVCLLSIVNLLPWVTLR